MTRNCEPTQEGTHNEPSVEANARNMQNMQESTSSTVQRRNPSPRKGTSMDIGRPMTRSMYKKLQNPNLNPGETNPGPGEGTSSGVVGPMIRNMYKKLQNLNSDPREKNPGPGEGTSLGTVGPNIRNMKQNPNPKQRHPGPSKGTWNNYQANPNFRSSDGRPPRNEKEEIAILRSQLQQSLYMQQTSHHKMVAANQKAAKYKVQLDWVQLQLNCCRQNAENTIQVLQAQLEEARRNRPESYTEENFIAQLSEAPTEGPAITTDVAGKNPITAQPDETFDALEVLNSHHAAELHVEASTQTMEAPHTDSVELKTTREADLETQCKKQQEQIDKLQEQLLKAQKQLEEEAAKREQEEERARCEIAELKAKLCTSEALHEENVLKVQNFKQELETTKASYMEIVEKQKQENVNETLQETLESQQKKKARITKLDDPEAQSETLQKTLESQQEKVADVGKLGGPEEIPKKKKKKRGWLRRLFTCGSAAST